MDFDLVKGDSFNLTKENPGLKRVRFNLSWDNPTDADLDASAIGLKSGKLFDKDYVMFFNHSSKPKMITADGAIHHSGDNRDGKAAGVDESILIDIPKITAACDEITFFVTVFSPVGLTFGNIGSASISLVDEDTKKELACYNLKEQFSTETALQFGSLNRTGSDWTFTAIGGGYTLDIGGVLSSLQ